MINYVEASGPVSVAVTDGRESYGNYDPDRPHCMTINTTGQSAIRLFLTTEELHAFAIEISERLRSQQPLVERMDPI